MKPQRWTKPIRHAPPTPQHILRVLLPTLDASVQWRLIGPPIRSRQAHVYHARAAGRDGDVAVKVYHEMVYANQPRLQHRALEACYAGMQDRRFGVPRPLGWLDDEHVLFMEWIDGRPLSDSLWSWSIIPSRRRLDVLADAGRWLRGYHAAVGTTLNPFEPPAVLRLIDGHFEADPQFARLMMADAVFAGALERLHAAARRVEGVPIAYTTQHGDFTPYNLIDTGDRIMGIDILALRDQPVLSDVSRFLIYADVRKYALTLGWQMGALGVRAADAQAFLHGYGVGIADATSPVAMVVHLAEVLRRWSRVGRKPRTGRRAMLWRHEAFRMRRITAGILRAMDKAGM